MSERDLEEFHTHSSMVDIDASADFQRFLDRGAEVFHVAGSDARHIDAATADDVDALGFLEELHLWIAQAAE